MHTPYGATEALPVATISAREVLQETAARTQDGAGVCVGGRFPGIEWKIVRIDDGPIAELIDANELPTGEVGELIVQGPTVTRSYVTRTEWNALSKIRDGDRVWHRMGDVGYLDEQDRFWYRGRKSQRVQTATGVLYTECCEAIFNQHPKVYRTALVGVGLPGQAVPVIVIEPRADCWPKSKALQRGLRQELLDLGRQHSHTEAIDGFLFHRGLPVDIRHNSKIFRERLATWAAQRLRRAIG
jgi:acyl-CoA synthetase (AMP-forming)/AMP-acid ligase II